MENDQGLRISKKTFLGTVCVLLCVVLVAGILTLVLPQGRFETDESGTMIPGSYHHTQGRRLPVYRWLTAPFEVMIGTDAVMVWMIALFLLVIGGVFYVLDKGSVISAFLASAIKRYGANKYKVLSAVTFLSMLLGATMGLFEELAAIVPLMVAFSLAMGWDSLVGLGMSILAVGFGFTAGIFNPFSVLIAQKLAGIPLFSGMLFRIFTFAVIYLALNVFLTRYAKKIEKDPTRSIAYETDGALRSRYMGCQDLVVTAGMHKSMKIFGFSVCAVLGYIVLALICLYTGVTSVLSDITMPVMILLIGTGGLVAGRRAYGNNRVFKDFVRGMVNMLPGVALIVLAMSVKHIVVIGGVMDTILNEIYLVLSGVGGFGAILLVFLFVLVLEFFISSASAKAFIVIPLLVPIVSLIGLTRQTVIQAFCFADGFSNMFFPTSGCLLIVLGLVNLSYGKWVRWSSKIMLVMLGISVALMMLAVAICYGP
ncbi:MAG: YfcC family protein [Clostridia bacterium]|nr:YfcC family protein [Clostridia bacterium]